MGDENKYSDSSVVEDLNLSCSFLENEYNYDFDEEFDNISRVIAQSVARAETVQSNTPCKTRKSVSVNHL